MSREVENALQGTTGNPKGVVLTQGALAAATYSNMSGWDLPAGAVPVMLSYLPLAHIYGVNQFSFRTGTKSHFYPRKADTRTQHYR